jgi:hypothetical protein
MIDQFYYIKGYCVCSEGCASEIRSKGGTIEGINQMRMTLKPIETPKIICTICLSCIDDNQFIAHGYHFCDENCYTEWRQKLYGNSEIVSF